MKLDNNVEFKLLKEQVEEYNAKVGNLYGFKCDKCKNKGWVDTLEESEFGYYDRVANKCDCLDLREIQRHTNSQLGEYNNKSFDDFIVKEDWQRDIKNKALQYVQDKGKKWFVITGQVGSGKTMISSIIVNQLSKLNRNNVVKIGWIDFISSFKRQIMISEQIKVADERFENIKKVDVLFIDEALKTFNDVDLKYFTELINYRYMNNLKTIITSEKDIKQLLEIDEATFSRVIEKSDIYLTNIPKDISKNQRIKKIYVNSIN